MESQEQQGSTCLKPVCNPHNQMHVDAKTSSICGPHLNEIDSSGEEHAPRVRKPYTITKRRERWTEEEHKKFLEALQLYGRAWRRIEEHIGTKTAVQIRSHAQKFFSKVVRESGSNDSTGTWKAIEIPPPRPKRKPIHPYPRKLGNLSNKGTLVLKQLERPPLKIPAICEQDNRSPTSVLSAVGSETLDSTFAHGQLDCSSPVASAAGSNDHNDGGQSPTMTAQEVNKFPCSDPAFPRVTMQEQPQMEIDQYPGVHTSSEAPLPTLKLFGKMVVVTNSNKSSIPAPSARDGAQPNFVSSVDNRRHQENNAFDSHSRSERLQSATHGVDLTRSEWNGYPGVMPPFIYCFTLVGDNSGESTFPSPPCWTMYGNLPFPLVHPQPQYPPQFPPEATSDQDIQREGSWTGSNTASIGGAVPSDQNADGVDSKKVENLAEDGPMPCSGVKSSHIPASTSGIVGSGRGFVPYKRCSVESEVQHPVAASDDGESQALRLCL